MTNIAPKYTCFGGIIMQKKYANHRKDALLATLSKVMHWGINGKMQHAHRQRNVLSAEQPKARRYHTHPTAKENVSIVQKK